MKRWKAKRKGRDKKGINDRQRSEKIGSTLKFIHVLPVFLNNADKSQSQNQNSKDNPIPAENFEIVFFNITHQKFDDENRNNKGDGHSKDEDDKFGPVKLRPNFSILIALRPNMTGTARKKVNSAATTRETPISRAPIMVAPGGKFPG